MRYRLPLMDKRGECIHSRSYDTQDEAFVAMKQFDLIKFQVTLENVEKYAQLIIGVVKGPSSPIIYNGKHEICVWDKWSHYERPGYESLLGGLVPDYQAMLKIKIKVLSKSIDYSACTREFSYEGTKVLKVRGLYGINSSILKVDSL